ncbi:substrate-binding domain-containing protein [Natronohydrobacter thiooxidans]|uniref:substrate-binding domain-containing protein n=1 Tax=Natronohydrobacter thiooxidans TaxID=87172 RepID=UPI001587F2D7|nr:substrate-binding domain-containing protein [Natronohydrobacter thiooxidans]
MSASQRLESYIESLALNARPGDRVPPVRHLMAQFGVSQAVVMRATERLKLQGRISAEVGRGTFFSGGEAEHAAHAEPREAPEVPDQRSVLFLRRSIRLQRGRRVLERLHIQLQDMGCRVVEVAYTDSRDALDILRNMPRFDTCVLQSTFETIAIDMLAAAHRLAPSIVIDGAVLAGTEVDSVGFEWASAVDLALDHLAAAGHNRVGLLLSTHFVLAAELGRIRFDSRRQTNDNLSEPIRIPAWPHEDFVAKAAEAVAGLRQSAGDLPFTALIVWGIEDGADFVSQLARRGIDVPADLSIVLLGRTDLVNEHAEFFTVAGSTTEAQAEALEQTIRRRWAQPDSDYRVTYLPLTLVPGKSVNGR